MPNNPNNHCRVCGLEQAEPPWGEDGTLASFDICDCCGVEFGYEDATLKGVRMYRERWLAGGAHWSRPSVKPVDWQLDAQLQQIPPVYC